MMSPMEKDKVGPSSGGYRKRSWHETVAAERRESRTSRYDMSKVSKDATKEKG